MPIVIIPLVLITLGAFIFFNSDVWEKMREPKRGSSIEPKHEEFFNINR